MRYSVLTYIFNGYETVHEIIRKDEEAEYILVTDDPSLRSRTWKVVCDERLKEMSAFDKCYQVRFHPFDYCITDVVVRIDGSIIVKDSLKDIVDAYQNGGYDMALMIHPERNRIVEEYDTWVRRRGYPREQMSRCIGVMNALGYDFKYCGLYQGTFIIQRRNKANEDANNITYDLLRYMGGKKIERLDQTVFSFVLNTLFDNLHVMPVSECLITASRYMQWCLHNSCTPIPDKEEKITPFLFNRKCETLW